MARFDVYRFSATTPFVIDVQADLLAHLGSTVVIPLLPERKPAEDILPKLNPLLHLAGNDYRLMTTDIVGVPRTKLGPWVASLEHQRGVIVEAIDTS